MTLRRRDFGRALRDELEKGYDITRIARWAYQLHLDARNFEAGLEAEVLRLIAMEEGPQFVISEPELRKLATDLEAHT